jgi:hypothetical protein
MRFERVLGLRMMSHGRAGRGAMGTGSCGTAIVSALLRAVVLGTSSGTLFSEAIDEWPLSLLGAGKRVPLSYEAHEFDLWWPERPVRVEALSLILVRC